MLYIPTHSFVNNADLMKGFNLVRGTEEAWFESFKTHPHRCKAFRNSMTYIQSAGGFGFSLATYSRRSIASLRRKWSMLEATLGNVEDSISSKCANTMRGAGST